MGRVSFDCDIATMLKPPVVPAVRIRPVVCRGRWRDRVGRGETGRERRVRGRVLRQLGAVRLKASSSGSELEQQALKEIPVLERIQFGVVTRVFSPEELEKVFDEFPGTLVVLECKAKYCRPCMAFAKRYMKFAEEFQDVLFLEIMGDENKETRMMMVEFDVKATPTFRYYVDGECVTITVGIKQEKVRSAILFARPHKAASGTL